MTDTHKGNCWFCGITLSPLHYGRGDSCPQCKRDTRTCKGCIFFDSSCHNECREPSADRVLEKERSNFCDYFTPKQVPKGGGDPQREAQDKAKEAAEALFKFKK